MQWHAHTHRSQGHSNRYLVKAEENLFQYKTVRAAWYNSYLYVSLRGKLSYVKHSYPALE